MSSCSEPDARTACHPEGAVSSGIFTLFRPGGQAATKSLPISGLVATFGDVGRPGAGWCIPSRKGKMDILGKCGYSRVLSSIALCLICSATVLACSVPVFRYALERWPADDYGVVIVYESSLSKEQQGAVDYLRQQTREENGALNLDVYPADVTSDEEAFLTEFARKHRGKAPTIHLLYPRYSEHSEPIWSGELTMQNVHALAHSKLLNTVSGEILKGKTAVWILLESGDKAKDDEASRVLDSVLLKAEEEFVLPDGIMTADGEVTGDEANDAAGGYGGVNSINMLQSPVPLEISFSTERLSRDSPEEQILLATLMNIEPDLHDLATKPMAFPVFGQGRVLEPLVGLGINEENIASMTYYLCGPCSCQVKFENPGVDLLVARDWYAVLEGHEIIEDRERPPLSGVADLVDQEGEVDRAEKPVLDQEDATDNRNILLLRRSILVVASLFLVAAVVGSFLLRKRK